VFTLLVGTLDSARTQFVMEKPLEILVATGADHAVIDITGVPTVDTEVAQHLLKTVSAARLLGRGDHPALGGPQPPVGPRGPPGPGRQGPARHRGRAAGRGRDAPRRRRRAGAQAMTDEFARLRVRDLNGVFAARRLGRELAARLTLDRQDQVRVATALSEICHSAVTAGQTAVIAFAADDADLLLTVTADGEPPADGITAAARLMDTVVADGRVIRMAKRRPLNAQPDTRAIREDLAAMLPESALVEVRRNNDDLIATLEDLKAQKEQLLLLDLLDVAKAESGQLPIDPAEVNLPLILATLRGLARPIAEGKPVEVVVSADDAPATMLTDEVALTAILRNLLSDAIKYTDEGEVRLTVRTAGDSIEIRVSDTGAGLPADQIERVFEEFYQRSMLVGIAGRLVEAEDGAQALAVIAADGADLVITDLIMPGVDGNALLGLLPDGLPAIVVTGLDVTTPPRASALLHKKDLTRERLAFAIRGVSEGVR
jgi:signal transduction histidine kinase